jgi:hypothetical protein
MTRNSEITRAVRRTLILSAVATAGASLPIHVQDRAVSTCSRSRDRDRVAHRLTASDEHQPGNRPQRSGHRQQSCSLYYTGQKVVRSDKNPRGE